MNLKEVLNKQVESLYNQLKPMIPVYVSTWQGIEKLFHLIVQGTIDAIIDYINSGKSDYIQVPKIKKIEDENILYADGFEDAFMGYANVFNKTIAIYHTQMCIRILMDRDKMSLEEATEYFDYNVQGAYVGENTPGFFFVNEGI